MNRVSILSIVPYQVLPAKLGGEKGIALFNQYLGKKVPLLVLTTKNNEIAHAKNYDVLLQLSVSRRRYINLFLYFRIRKLIRQHNISHLLIEHPYYGWLAWMIRKTLPVTWVVHSHNIEFMRSKSIGRRWWKALKWYEAAVYRAADINFFISEDDKRFAEKELGIDPAKSHAITYGIEQDRLPRDTAAMREKIQNRHGLPKDMKIFLFNGALYHHTNYHALETILDRVNPLLLAEAGFDYRIIVCGRGLPEKFNDLREYADSKVVYAGFVDDISEYFKAADIFLNPITTGGGVKTKAIEAIGYNCTVISYKLGALGIKQELCGDKLHVIEDDDPRKFASAVLKQAIMQSNTPPGFYEYYSWEGITDKVKKILESHA